MRVRGSRPLARRYQLSTTGEGNTADPLPSPVCVCEGVTISQLVQAGEGKEQLFPDYTVTNIHISYLTLYLSPSPTLYNRASSVGSSQSVQVPAVTLGTTWDNLEHW